MARWMFLLAAAALLAGCSDDAATTPDDPVIDSEDVKVRDGFGAIAGVVVDEAIRPVAGATVALDGNRTAVSGEGGQFAFEDVVPGAHVLHAALSAYLPADVAIAVTEGEVLEVRLTMARDPVPQPYGMTLKFTGRIEASLSLVTFTSDLVTGDLLGTSFCQCEFNFTAGPDVEAITLEGIWTETMSSPAGPFELYWEMWPSNYSTDDLTDDYIASGYSTSPMHVYLDRNATWSGKDADGAFTTRLTGSDTWPHYEQEYELYVTLWYNGPGDAGFTALSA